MSQAYERARHVFRTITDGFYNASAWLFMVVVVATAYEVVARYFFRAPTIWANEMTVMVCAIAFVIAGPYVMRRDEHLSITILSENAPPMLRRVLATLKWIVIVWMCLALSVFSFESGWEPLVRWERAGTQWNPPLPAILKPLIVVAAFIMAVQSTVNFVRQIRSH
jgi:TRAP-type C4-dicarboxylate transport system permease small subunit